MMASANFAIIITALDETWSVRETIDTVMKNNPEDIADIIMAIAPKTTAACRQVIDDMEKKYPHVVRYHEQKVLPGVGGANIEIFDLIDAPWTIMMASDLETPPDKVQTIIARAKQEDVDVVATSRWHKAGSFGNYNKVKLLCNWIFQKFFSILYQTSLTDMTYGYRACRTDLFKRYQWSEYGHAFFMESLVVMLRDQKKIVEVPMTWARRQEGESNFKLSQYLRYFYIGFRTRWTPVSKLLKG